MTRRRAKRLANKTGGGDDVRSPQLAGVGQERVVKPLLAEAVQWSAEYRLQVVLDEARKRGLLGPGPAFAHINHALGFMAVLGRAYPAFRGQESAPQVGMGPRLLDLGSGGGLPGLVIASRWPVASLVLLDSQRRRTDFLEKAVDQLGLGRQVAVICERAELAGREPSLRGCFDAVVARSFGPPGVTAECGSPFLQVEGHLVVSEPPVERFVRWPVAELANLGMTVGEVASFGGFIYQRLTQARPCPQRFPRRTGVPSKRPLFHVEPHPGLDAL